MDDATLVDLFDKGELREFPHLDHIRVVFARTRQTNRTEAIEFTRRGLRALTQRVGAPDKYHDTLTVAWARIIGTLTEQAPNLDFDDFMRAHPELARSSLMDEYYSREVLHSAAARARFIEPDLRDLP
ncbi:hypothetical protein FHU38_002249 [Saccharomonospora amisosensis]|uniref:Uncharacterized protein n=1 Tax=Saccharomonospora amisosensis TaxID=1128677 RepID=A0A7X5ZR26_9PSEU|nr:hypothetical protein [Saccharomonospora amisosensis]NIJ11905.1 hypothetical protein [Saccharomonospora amisosensis]